MCSPVHMQCASLECDPSAATVQQPHQDRTEHSRSSTPFDHPNWAYLSHAGGQIRTHPESPQRLCTAEVRGSNPLGSTLKTAVLQVKRETTTVALNARVALVQQRGGEPANVIVNGFCNIRSSSIAQLPSGPTAAVIIIEPGAVDAIPEQTVS